MRIGRRVPTACAIALVLTVGVSNGASATVFFCGSGDVGCVIRSIESANAGRGADTIILEAGTYAFTVANNTVDTDPVDAAFRGGGNALPSITGRMTIQGAGPTETILDGSRLLRLFHIAASGRLTLHGLTIQQGHVTSHDNGGAIFNRGTLTVSEAVIRDNRIDLGDGGGIYSVGTLRVIDSRITNNFAAQFCCAPFPGEGGAGGIYSVGALQVLRSTIDHNSDGGGIRVTGTVTIKDSAIARNGRFGPGLVVFDGTVTITNTTFANNLNGDSIGGGMLVRSGTVLLTNVTIADNFSDGGGGLAISGGTVELQNTILARNSSLRFLLLEVIDCFGSIVSLGHNIIGNTEGCTIDLASTDFVGDPRLGVLVDNDDIPGHEYIPLLAESPAIDAGNRAACPRRDQLRNRRVDIDGNRPVRCDIGALEFIPAP